MGAEDWLALATTLVCVSLTGFDIDYTWQCVF